jgi:hypothetical protein
MDTIPPRPLGKLHTLMISDENRETLMILLAANNPSKAQEYRTGNIEG